MEIQADTVLSTEHDNARPAVEIVVPVFNEERDLAASIRRLQKFLSSSFPFSALVTIADNGRTDGTWATATALAGWLPGVRALRIPEAGRGRALQKVWSASDAEVVAYMDVDLSTDLSALLPLAERVGLRIHEVPVDWVDDPDSRVDIVATAAGDLRGVARLARQLAGSEIPIDKLRAELGLEEARRPHPAPAAQRLRFAGIGAVSTLAYVGLYLLGRTWLSAQAANALALLATAVPNIAANRRLTFGIRGLRGSLRHHARALVMFAVALLLTSGALDTLHTFAPDAGRRLEVGILVLANLAATAVRLPLMRTWVFQTCPSRLDSIPVAPRLRPGA